MVTELTESVAFAIGSEVKLAPYGKTPHFLDQSNNAD